MVECGHCARLQGPLDQAGIEEASWLDSLELMAEQALASGSPANNPRVPTADIVELYRRVWR